MSGAFISGIYNYCDRWCERCAFQHRCEIYADEQALTDEQKDPGNPAFWDYIHDCFEKALEVVEQFAEEEGLDVEAFHRRPEAEVARREVPPEHQAIQEMGHDYAHRTMNWLKENHSTIEGYQQNLRHQLNMGIDTSDAARRFSDALDAVQWYSTITATKTYRALQGHGLQKEWYWDSPIQSDANGTAKVALLCIERSLGAWEGIRSHLPHHTNEIISLLALLAQLRHGLKSYFPDAEKFIRPGFDQPEYYPQ